MLVPLEKIKTVGLAGTGSVGAAWAALMLASGYEVVAYDADAVAAERLPDAVQAAWPVIRALNEGVVEEAPLERLRIVGTIEEMAAASDLVQENVAEALEVKRDVFARIDAVLPPDRLILSSSGGVPPSTLQSFCTHPARVVLGHPFHPAYVIPLVEVVGGKHTSAEAVDLAVSFYQRLGKRPIRLRKELIGHLTNRLQFAMLREAIHCLNEEVASADDIDAAVRWGLGLRWALMGPLMTFNLAGGSGGVKQIVERFRDDVHTWWDALGDPRLDEAVSARLFDGVEQLRHGRSNEEWAIWRDDALIDLLKFRASHPYLGEQSSASERG